MDPLFKKLIRDYNYLLETLHDVKEISSIAEGEFRNALMETDPEAVQALVPPKKQVIENIEIKDIEVENSNDEPINDDPKFKKLFRKIAIKCHPDKLRGMTPSEIKFYKRVYEDLTEANRKYDWGMLLKLAMELDIEVLDIGADEVKNISDMVISLSHSIKKYENSMAFAWYTKNDENSKKEYLAMCAILFKKSLNKTTNPKDQHNDI